MAAINIVASLQPLIPAPFVSAGALRSVAGVMPFATGGAVLTDTYYQRVYDTTVGWCYYVGTVPSSSPSSSSTEPNHTGNLTTHEILAVS